jgi:hypothetical protein
MSKYRVMTQILAETEFENSLPVRAVGIQIVLHSLERDSVDEAAEEPDHHLWPCKPSKEITFLVSACRTASVV